MPTEKGKLREKMSSRFRATRKQLDITQEKMAELLDIDLRSYSDLEHGKSLCSTPVFIRYLSLNKPDVMDILNELEEAANVE